MNASALLTRQGWLGDGHALDRAGRGAKRPIGISKKSNTLGVGKKKVDVHADQWWARAFDEGLKGLSPGTTDSSVGTTVVSKPAKISELNLLANGGKKKWLGLYGGFVKGEGLEGTIGREVVDGVGGEGARGLGQMGGMMKKQKKKRRRGRDGEDGDEVVLLPVLDGNDAAQELKKRKKKKRKKVHASSNGQSVLDEAEVEVVSSPIVHGKNYEATEKIRSKASTEAQLVPDKQPREERKRKHKKKSSSAG